MSTGARGNTHPDTVVIARFLRSNPTRAEAILWEALRTRRLCGLKFRRQHPFDKFILDFFCPQLQLAVELDGSVHNSLEQRDYDAAREEFLCNRGIQVLRFTNEEVEKHLDRVLGVIEAAATRSLKIPGARPPFSNHRG